MPLAFGTMPYTCIVPVLGVDPIVAESQFAFVREPSFAVQAEFKRGFSVFHVGQQVAETPAGCADAFRVPQHRPFIDIEINANRIDGHDRR